MLRSGLRFICKYTLKIIGIGYICMDVVLWEFLLSQGLMWWKSKHGNQQSISELELLNFSLEDWSGLKTLRRFQKHKNWMEWTIWVPLTSIFSIHYQQGRWRSDWTLELNLRKWKPMRELTTRLRSYRSRQSRRRRRWGWVIFLHSWTQAMC